MRCCIQAFACLFVTFLPFGGAFAIGFPHRKQKAPETATIIVQSGKPSCRVDIDGVVSGRTNSEGRLVLPNVSPSSHYIHVECAGQPASTTFVSPKAGSTTEVQPQPLPSDEGGAAYERSENNLELRKLLSEAVDDRADGRFPQAVQTLRRAIQLDPGNPGLHHELGMTFLMIEDWDNAAVELREAIRDDPSSAGAHSGLGYALEKQGDLKEALDQFRVATHLDPDDSSYQDHYVEVLGMLASQQAGKKKRK